MSCLIKSDDGLITNSNNANRMKLSKLTVALFTALGFVSNSNAENYFNPRFLSDDPKAVADLSQFEKGSEGLPGTYRVDIFLNDGYVTTRDVKFSISKNNSLFPCLTKTQLTSMGVNTFAVPGMNKYSGDVCVPITELITDSSVRFEIGTQKLMISVPQSFMSNKGRGYIPPELWDNGIPAALVNYNFTAGSARGRATSDNYFLNLQSGVNLGPWRLRDNTTWSYNSGGGYTPQKDAWTHINTYLERDIIAWKSRLTLGDGYTASDIFDSVNFRGAQIGSVEEMLPESRRGFAPTIHGIARGTARVSVKQNGYEIYQTTVPPGPFTINDLYPSGSSGDLQVTIFEADGHSQVFSVPYSSVPMLQREGQVKYGMTVGKFRSGGDQNTTPTFTQGELLWGLPFGLTAYGGTQLSDNYRAFNVGLGKNLGVFGAMSMDITQANSVLADDTSHQGQSLRFLYNKSLNELGTNFQLVGYRYSTEGFYTLADTAYNRMSGYTIITQDGPLEIAPKYTDYYNLQYSKRGKLQASISQQIGRSATLYLTGSSQSYWRTDATDTSLQLGYNGLISDISYSLSYSLNKNAWQQGKDQMVAFSLSIPLSHWLTPDSRSIFRRSNINFSAANDLNGKTTTQTGIAGTLLDDSSLSYSVMQGYGTGDQGYMGNLGMEYRGPYGSLNGGYSSSSGLNQYYYGVNGAAVLHQDGITLSQPFTGSVVLVKAPGAGGIGIENKPGVRTDKRGYAIVPYATDYRDNRIALNVNSLPNNVDLEDPVIDVVPTHDSIIRAQFKAKVGVKLLMTVMHNGKPLPFGALINSDTSSSGSIVGEGGQVYLTGLPLKGLLTASWGSGTSQNCKISYTLPESALNKTINQLSAQCM